MRRALVSGVAAVVVAAAAACGGDDEPVDNTAQVCDAAERVQWEQSEQLNEDLTALQERDLEPEEFQDEVVEVAQQALVGWSDGLREQAGQANDPQLAGALTDLADGLTDAASQLTFAHMETGTVPGAEELDQIGQTLTEICDEAPAPGS
jgi:hypothetical protein